MKNINNILEKIEMKIYLELEDIKKLEDAADFLRDKIMIRLLYFLAFTI